MRLLVGVVCVLLILSAGCSIVMPKDQRVIHDHYLNAKAINEKVQADQSLPDYAKRWWAAEERTWYALDMWAKGKAASPAPQPSEVSKEN